MKQVKHIWNSQVRSHELDNQSIVNNAIYMQYFANARLLYLNELGINWDNWQKRGIDLVLYKAEIFYRYPLYAFDDFYIESEFRAKGRSKIEFIQKLYNNENKLCSDCSTLSVCVNQKTGKVVVPKELMEHLVNSYATI